MKFVIVETDDGERQFFDHLSDGLRYAKIEEERRRHSVEYVGQWDELTEEASVYRGQELRWLLRTLDNVNNWMKAVNDKTDL